MTQLRRVLHVMTVPVSLRFLSGQPKYMRERGYELGVACGSGELLEQFAQTSGVWARGFSVRRAISPLSDLVAIRQLVSLIQEFRPDIVHGHTPKGGLIGMLGARLAGVSSTIYHLRGFPLATAIGFRAKLLEIAERTTCALASEVVSVSASLKHEVVSRGIVPSRKVRVLRNGSGNGVDTQRFHPADASRCKLWRRHLDIPGEAVVFLFVGRLTRDKGVRELIDAWRTIDDERAWLVVVGESDERAPLEPSLMERLRGPRVRWLPFTEEIEQIYSLADVALLPTYREGFPNAALEAAAMGLPIVASRVVGCVDAVIHEQTGILVEPRSSEALREGMLRYLEDDEVRRRHGRAGRVRVERDFQPAGIHEALTELYDSMLNGAIQR